jgi:hypothetical protein
VEGGDPRFGAQQRHSERRDVGEAPAWREETVDPGCGNVELSAGGQR